MNAFVVIRIIIFLAFFLAGGTVGAWYQMCADRDNTIYHCQRYNALKIDGVVYVCYRKGIEA